MSQTKTETANAPDKPEILDSENEILRRLRPVLGLRAAGSGLAVIGVWTLHWRTGLFSMPMLLFITFLGVAVNLFSFIFIKKKYPAYVFAMFNGTLFSLLLGIAMHYTGGMFSPFILGFLFMIFIIDTVSGSLWATIGAGAIACVCLDTVILLHFYGVVTPHPFVLSVRMTYRGEPNPWIMILCLNWFFMFVSAVSGYLMSVNGRVRMELERANREKFQLQGVIRSMVSHTTWTEISNAARAEDTGPLAERRAERTILFTDIAGFSTLSENMSPEAVIAMLNAHFQILGGIIYQHGVDIDKFIGDSVMAVFENAGHAVAAAVAIQEAMAELNATQKKATVMRVRIGVNTGEVVIGNMGAEERMDRTLIGDAVNIAQRLESMADPDGIMISETTFRAITAERARFRSVGRLRLKGKKQRIRAYAYTPLK